MTDLNEALLALRQGPGGFHFLVFVIAIIDNVALKKGLFMGQNKTVPDSVKASLTLSQQARVHIQKGNLDEADTLLRRALERAETAEAHHYTGVVHYLRGDRAGAVTALQAALAID